MGRSLLSRDQGESLQTRVTEREGPRAEPCLSQGVMGRRDREGGTATWSYSGLGILRAAGEQMRLPLSPAGHEGRGLVYPAERAGLTVVSGNGPGRLLSQGFIPETSDMDRGWPRCKSVRKSKLQK